MQILQASVTGLEAKKPYVLALANHPDGSGELEPLSAFMTNPVGSAIVNSNGPIRQIVESDRKAEHRRRQRDQAGQDRTARDTRLKQHSTSVSMAKDLPTCARVIGDIGSNLVSNSWRPLHEGFVQVVAGEEDVTQRLLLSRLDPMTAGTGTPPPSAG